MSLGPEVSDMINKKSYKMFPALISISSRHYEKIPEYVATSISAVSGCITQK